MTSERLIEELNEIEEHLRAWQPHACGGVDCSRCKPARIADVLADAIASLRPPPPVDVGDTCNTCGRRHYGPGLSCNQSRFVQALMIDLDPIVGRFKPAALQIIRWNLKHHRP